MGVLQLFDLLKRMNGMFEVGDQHIPLGFQSDLTFVDLCCWRYCDNIGSCPTLKDFAEKVIASMRIYAKKTSPMVVVADNGKHYNKLKAKTHKARREADANQIKRVSTEMKEETDAGKKLELQLKLDRMTPYDEAERYYYLKNDEWFDRELLFDKARKSYKLLTDLLVAYYEKEEGRAFFEEQNVTLYFDDKWYGECPYLDSSVPHEFNESDLIIASMLDSIVVPEGMKDFMGSPLKPDQVSVHVVANDTDFIPLCYIKWAKRALRGSGIGVSRAADIVWSNGMKASRPEEKKSGRGQRSLAMTALDALLKTVYGARVETDQLGRANAFVIMCIFLGTDFIQRSSGKGPAYVVANDIVPLLKAMAKVKDNVIDWPALLELIYNREKCDLQKAKSFFYDFVRNFIYWVERREIKDEAIEVLYQRCKRKASLTPSVLSKEKEKPKPKPRAKQKKRKDDDDDDDDESETKQPVSRKRQKRKVVEEEEEGEEEKEEPDTVDVEMEIVETEVEIVKEETKGTFFEIEDEVEVEEDDDDDDDDSDYVPDKEEKDDDDDDDEEEEEEEK